jgi:hypothetical protein
MEFIPKNDFEIKLRDAQQGISSMPDLLKSLLVAEVVVPSAAEVMGDGSGFQPLLFPKGETQMLACFSSKERIGDFATMAPYYLAMPGKDMLQRLPPHYGLVLNPGQKIGFDISPEGVAKIIREFT